MADLETVHATIDHTGITGTGAPQALDTTDSPQFAGVNLGHASDTTLTRVSAGVVAIEGTNIVKAGAATGSGLTMATARLLGRTTASTGAIEEISVGTGLTLSGGDLSATGSGTTELLAIASVATGTSYTTTSSTQADTNASVAVTFTAPASGNVLVRVTCGVSISASNNNAFLGLRESTTDVVNKQFAIQGQTATVLEQLATIAFYVTGISAGSHTYKLAFAVNGGASFVVRSLTTVPVIFEVWACP